jgi:hypothetical protein
MKRRQALALLLGVPNVAHAGSPPGYTDEFFLRLKRFDDAYGAFVRDFCAWKLNAPPPLNDEGNAMCSPGRGKYNFQEWKKVRKRAMKLFDLREKEK